MWYLSVRCNLKITITYSVHFRFIADSRNVTVIKPITRVADLSLVDVFQLIFVMDWTILMSVCQLHLYIICNRSILREQKRGMMSDSKRIDEKVRKRCSEIRSTIDRTIAEQILDSTSRAGAREIFKPVYAFM